MVKQSTSEGVGAGAPATTSAPVSYTQPTASTPISRGTRGAFVFIRPAQLVLAIVILGLTAYFASIEYCTSYYYDYCYRVNWPANSFMIFNAVWTMLITIYFIVATAKTGLYNPIAAVVLDALSMVFWFAGFIALAVLVGALSAAFEDTSSSWIGVSIAAVVVGAIEWILFMVTLVFSALSLRGYRSNGQVNATPMQQYPNQGVSQGVAQHA